MHKHNMV